MAETLQLGSANRQDTGGYREISKGAAAPGCSSHSHCSPTTSPGTLSETHHCANPCSWGMRMKYVQ